MVDVTVQTLMMSIQAIDAEIRSLRESSDGSIEDMDPDSQELLLAYSNAATELKTRYFESRKIHTNLPPYEQLVKVG